MAFINVVNEVFVKQQRGTVVVLNSFVPYNPATDVLHARRRQFFTNQEVQVLRTNATLHGTPGTVPPPVQSSDVFIGQDTYGWADPDPPFIKPQRGFQAVLFVPYNFHTDPTLWVPQAKVFVEPDIFIKKQYNPQLWFTSSLILVTVPNVVGEDLTAANNDLSAAHLVGAVISSQYDPVIPLNTVISQAPLGGQMAPFGSTVMLVLSLGPAPPPPFVGITLPEAIFIAINSGLVVGEPTVWQYDPVIPYNYVISQKPPAGSSIPQQSVVTFVVSLGPAPAAPGMITVPDFTNLMILDAQNQAVALGLGRANKVLYVYSSVVAGGYVVTQSIVPGTIVAPGTAITFTVSVGTPVTTLPGAQIVTPTMH